jgi:methylated-DNA-[protein]-cysteine S-methyltransferase
MTREVFTPMLEQQIRAGKLSPAMSFNQKVWALTARIPKGKVVTYGDIARALNCTAYRAVGNALNKNPYAPSVPCHRVVGSDGSLTGFAGGLEKKRELLKREGLTLRANGKLDLTDALFTLEAQ